jgi:hypothetical protein
MSVNARVVLLVEDDKTMIHDVSTKSVDSHITENSTSLSAFGSILKIFGGNRCRLM